MQNTDIVSRLMTEVAPLLDLITITEYEAEAAWTLQIDEDILLIADLDADRECLVLSATVGHPSNDNREAILERLLLYNDQWHRTGGVRMALDGKEGEVIQMVDVPLPGLNAARWQLIITNFVALLRTWKELVKGAGITEDHPGPLPDGLIRA